MLSDMDEFRKDPTLLFDYNTPPLDAVTRITPPLTLHPEPQPGTTVAERTAGRATPPAGRTTPPVVRRTSASDSSEARRAAREREAQRRRQQEEESRSRVATIAIITCSVVAVIAIVIFMVILLGNGGITANANLVEVPNLSGSQFDPELTIEGLTITKDEVYDEKIPAGQIISQKPEGGEKVSKGSRLVLKVSLGATPAEITMDDLSQMPKDWVITRLNSLDLDLNIQIEYEFHDTIVEDSVIRTTPGKGAALTAGQTVTIYLSKGPEIKSGQMPNVLEMSEEKAVEVLDKQNFDLKYVTEQVYDSELKEGYVVKTEPASGEELKTGMTVKLYISKGAEMKVMPNVVGMDVDKAVNIIMSAGFKTPVIERINSDKAKDQVVTQSQQKNTEIDVNTEIILEVSDGPAMKTKDVEIRLEGQASEVDCKIVVVRDNAEVYNASVAAGTAQVTVKGQTGTGVVKYHVSALASDGTQLESWDVTINFG